MDCYQDDGIFISNNKEVKIGSKAVALILGLRIMTLGFKPNASDDEPTFKDKFFLALNRLAIRRSTNQFWQEVH